MCVCALQDCQLRDWPVLDIIFIIIIIGIIPVSVGSIMSKDVRDDMRDSPAAGFLLLTDKQGQCQMWTWRQGSAAKLRQTKQTLSSLAVLFLSQ